MHQLFHDARHARQHFERGVEIVRLHTGPRRVQFVQHELHPQLAGLMLDDEEHFVVRRREQLLRAKDGVELQVVAVAHAVAEVELRQFVLDDLLGRRAAARGFVGVRREVVRIGAGHG